MHFNVIFSQKLADFTLSNMISDIHLIKPSLFMCWTCWLWWLLNLRKFSIKLSLHWLTLMFTAKKKPHNFPQIHQSYLLVLTFDLLLFLIIWKGLYFHLLFYLFQSKKKSQQFNYFLIWPWNSVPHDHVLPHTWK